jgi:hypothetical protein
VRGRIRQLKPDFALDEEFWALVVRFPELHLHHSFSQLWCHADREGRFEWRPAMLKSQILPYWDGDFSRVLEVLRDAGYLVSYEVDGKRYGWIKSFHKHQRPNSREPASVLPPPPDHALHARTSLHAHAQAPRASQHPTPNTQHPTPTPTPTPQRDAPPESAPEHTQVRPIRAVEPPVIPAEYRQFPKGWRWSDDTEQAALIEGVTAADLREHVEFWTTHAWSVPVTDLDGELRRSIGNIRMRRETARAKARASPRAAAGAPPPPKGKPAAQGIAEWQAEEARLAAQADIEMGRVPRGGTR